MYNSDPEQPMESTGIDPPNRELKRFKVMTTVLLIAFVISIGIASGFLVHQKNEHRDAIHERDETITELNQQLVQLKEEQNQKETEMKERLQQMKEERDEERKSVASLNVDIGRAQTLEKQFNEEAVRSMEERVKLKSEMEKKRELWRILAREYTDLKKNVNTLQEQLAKSDSSRNGLEKELNKIMAERELQKKKANDYEEQHKILRQIINERENEIGSVMEERGTLVAIDLLLYA